MKEILLLEVSNSSRVRRHREESSEVERVVDDNRKEVVLIHHPTDAMTDPSLLHPKGHHLKKNLM